MVLLQELNEAKAMLDQSQTVKGSWENLGAVLELLAEDDGDEELRKVFFGPRFCRIILTGPFVFASTNKIEA